MPKRIPKKESIQLKLLKIIEKRIVNFNKVRR